MLVSALNTLNLRERERNKSANKKRKKGRMKGRKKENIGERAERRERV
jgi:hypothetical protein